MIKNKGFTLFEVLISLLLSSALAVTVGFMLLFGYKSLTNIIETNKDSNDIMVFRSHIETRIQKMTSQGFILENTAPVDPTNFIVWRECDSLPDMQPNGLPDLSGAGLASNWTNLVGTKVTFNSVDPKSGVLIRCVYEYMPDTKEIKYSEYAATDISNNEIAVDFPAGTLRFSAVILKKIAVFQISDSSQGLPDWEAYNSATDASVPSLANSQKNAYIRIFVRSENEDVRYRANKSFIPRSIRREHTCWTPANKTAAWEYDPILVQSVKN